VPKTPSSPPPAPTSAAGSPETSTRETTVLGLKLTVSHEIARDVRVLAAVECVPMARIVSDALEAFLKAKVTPKMLRTYAELRKLNAPPSRKRPRG